MKIGYARVSTDEQFNDPQLDTLNEIGCERVYQEKFSGKSKNSPQLERMIDTLRKSDAVVVQLLICKGS